MAFRSSVPELTRPERSERWDRDRFQFEQDRDRDNDRERERDRFSAVRERFEDDGDRRYTRDPRGPDRAREPSERPRRRYDDEEDLVIRERRRVNYDDDPRIMRRRPSPPESEYDRRVMIERERRRVRSPSPPRRPGPMLRRQSSLDTFDRKPARHQRDHSPPARSDYRMPPNVPIPLPRSKALPPPRVYAEREFYEDIQVSDPHRFGDDDFHYPERVHEKEIIRTRRRRSRSRSSRATSHHPSTSRSSSTSSSSESGGTTVTGRSEYPKKGKTRIPARLVSKRALIDLGYPFVEEVFPPGFRLARGWSLTPSVGQHDNRPESSRATEH